MARPWGRVGQVIVDAFFPRTCVRCGAEGKDVCSTCWSAMFLHTRSFVCPACGKPSVIGLKHETCKSSLDGLLFAMPYADAVTHGLLRRWKFQFVRSVEPYLKKLMEEIPLEEILSGDDWLVVPIPLHVRKKRHRGFDQSAWIGKTVADRLNLPAGNVLERTRHTKQQSRQTVRMKEDLEGAFRARQKIEGRVILCDDVFTSGATMESAGKACRDAGATSVWGVVIAKG